MRAANVLLFLTACAAADPAGASVAEDRPDPHALLARVKEASGGPVWDRVRTLHMTMTMAAGGLKGSGQSWIDLAGGRYSDRYELGPASGAEGFDGKTAWEQDASGQVRPRDAADEHEQAVDEVYRRSRGYWYPERWEATIEDAGGKSEGGRAFATIRITPRGGRPFDLWIDAATSLIDRVVEKGATQTRTEFFSDYRMVEGLRIPFAARSSNGEARYDLTVSLEKVETNPAIGDARFAVPPSPPPDFAMAAGRTSTAVPFELVNNHIYVVARLNGRPFRVLCDTGGANVVTPLVARELGVSPQGTLQGQGVGEKSEDVGLAKLDRVQIGDASIDRQLFAVFDLARLEPAEGTPIPGLVGYEIFKRFVVRIDYGRHLLTLTLPGSFRPDARAKAIPFRFSDRTPEVDGAVDGIPGKFDIDTGSRASLDLLGPFVEKNGLVAHYGARLEGVTGWGVGGPARSMLARSRSLRLGSVEIPDVVTTLSVQKKGAFSNLYVAGNVGAGVLRRFTVTFDYGHQTLFLEPSSVDPGRDAYDRSGMWLNQGEEFFEVVDVIAGSPAQESGLRAGDRIVAVDGVPAGQLTLPDLRLRLRTEPPGKRIRLRVRSGAAERETGIVLRDLV